MMSKQSMRTSQTMPQLYYTREDIQEQYMGASKARKQHQDNNNSSTKSQAKRFLAPGKQTASGGGSKRARSSDPKRKESASSSASSSDDDADHDPEEEACDQPEAGGGSRGRRSHRSAGDGGRKRRRRRRAHSASLFSACFQIPNIGSMLPSSSSGGHSSHRRSFLSHLGLGGGGQQHSKQASRPISASQTLGNLQQVANNLQRPTAAQEAANQQQGSSTLAGCRQTPAANSQQLGNGSRKHVSFGGQPQPPMDDQAVQSGPTPMSPPPTSQQRNLKSAGEQRGNNVIMRNYQATHHKQQPTSRTQEAQAEANNSSQISKQSAAAASPIYLVSSKVTNSDGIGVGSPVTGMPKTHQPQSNAQVIYHNYPAEQQQQQQRSQTFINNQQANTMHSGCSGQVQQASLKQQQQHFPAAPMPQGYQQPSRNHPISPPVQQHQPPPTIYKRLPAVPMRTQATQTEITAYHLMATPPLSSSSSIAGRAGGGGNQSVASGSTTRRTRLSEQTATDSPGSNGTVAPPSADDQTPVRPPTGIVGASSGSTSSAVVGRDQVVGSEAGRREVPPSTGARAAASTKGPPPPAVHDNLRENRLQGADDTAETSTRHRKSRSDGSDADRGTTYVEDQGRARGEDDGSDEWSVDDEDDDGEDGGQVGASKREAAGVSGGESLRADELDCGSLKASALLSCSSSSSSSSSFCSSSSVSLVGHDSTLDLQPVAGNAVSGDVAAPKGRAAGKTAMQQRVASLEADDDNGCSTIPAMRRHTKPEAGASIMTSDRDDRLHPSQTGPGLKNDNTLAVVRKQESSSGGRHENGADDHCGAQGQRLAGRAGSSDIEPPCQFKDTSAAGRTRQWSADAAAGGLSGSDRANIIQSEFDLMGRAEANTSRTVDRAPSPPSLSEASSQTDASLAAHIMDLGQSLNNSRQFVGRSKCWPTSGPNSSPSNADDFSSRLEGATAEATGHARGDRRTGALVIESSQQVAGQLLDSCDDELEPLDDDYEEAGERTEAEEPGDIGLPDASCAFGESPTSDGGTMQRRTSAGGYGGGAKQSDHLADDYQPPGGDYEAHKMGASRQQRRSRENLNAASSGAVSEPADGEVNESSSSSGDGLIIDNDVEPGRSGQEAGDAPLAPEGDLLLSQQGDTNSKGRPQMGRGHSTASGASLAERRRNDFLTLEPELLAAGSSGQSASSAAGGTTTTSIRQQRPSTSTLSTRHHSYCSTDDFSPIPGEEAGSTGGPSSQLMDWAEEEAQKASRLGGLRPQREASVTSAPSRSHHLEEDESEDDQTSTTNIGQPREHQTIDSASSSSSSSGSGANASEQDALARARSGAASPADKQVSHESSTSSASSSGAAEAIVVAVGGGDRHNSSLASPLGRGPNLGALTEASQEEEEQAHSMAANGPDKAADCQCSEQTIKRDLDGAHFMVQAGERHDHGSHKISPLAEGDKDQKVVAIAAKATLKKAAKPSWEEVEQRATEAQQRAGPSDGPDVATGAEGSSQPLGQPAERGGEVGRDTMASLGGETAAPELDNNKAPRRRLGHFVQVAPAPANSATRDRAETEAASPNNEPANGAEQAHPCVAEHRAAGRHLDEGCRKLSGSPPTTVSELDQDEELSTPSFVDSFRNRLAEACKLADSVVGQAMADCLTAGASLAPAAPPATVQDTKPSGADNDDRLSRADGSIRRAADDASTANSLTGAASLASSQGSSLSQSSSTSVSGHSYGCCHPSWEPHSGSAQGARASQVQTRPKPPEKPAHLRHSARPAAAKGDDAGITMNPPDEQDSAELGPRAAAPVAEAKVSAAAALAVATTSVAGAAAALQIRYSSRDAAQKHQQDRELETSGHLEAPNAANAKEIEPATLLGPEDLGTGTRGADGSEFLGEPTSASKQASDSDANGGANNGEPASGERTLGPIGAQNAPLNVMAAGKQEDSGAEASQWPADHETGATLSNRPLGSGVSSASGSSDSPLMTASAAGQSMGGPSSSSFDCPALVSRSGSVCSAVSVIQSGHGQQQRPDECSNTGSAKLDGQGHHQQQQRRVGRDDDDVDAKVTGQLGALLPTAASGREMDEQPEAALTEDQSSPGPGEASARLSMLTSESGDSSGSGAGSHSPSSAASESRQATQGSVISSCVSSESLGPQQRLQQSSQQASAEVAGSSYQQSGEQFDAAEMPSTRRSSQELSTVSEVSEGELSLGPASLAGAATGQLSPSKHSEPDEASDGGRRGRRQEAPGDSAEQHSSDGRQAVGEAPAGAQEETQVAPTTELSQTGELATDHDLAHSEYTLRSQGSEAAVLTAGSSEAADYTNNPAGASKAQPAALRSPPPALPEVAPTLAHETQRRRSSASSKIPSSVIKAVGVDCPYVPDILPLSPPPPLLPSQQSAGVALQAHHRRLSHDDTMEAIEDDVEGEEQELQQQLAQKQQVAAAVSPQVIDIEPPLAFGGGPAEHAEHRVCTPADSIQEEDEQVDADGDDDDEESSISISQHGVIVSQEVPSPRNNRRAQQGLSSPEQSTCENSPQSSKSTMQQQQAPGNGNHEPPEVHRKDDVDDATVQPTSQHRQSASKSLSTESATHAILEHLSRHNHDLLLDEPAPALEQHENSFEATCSGTGTMKRKLKDGAPVKDSDTSPDGGQSLPAKMPETRDSPPSAGQSLEASSSSSSTRPQHKRGPPLGQMKTTVERGARNDASGRQQAVAGGASGSLATDASICSSCSCLEASFDSSVQEPPAAAPKEAQQTDPEHRHQLQKQPTILGAARSNWMSQEEGTVFTENYWLAHWLYISEHEESEIWRQAIDMAGSATAASTSAAGSSSDNNKHTTEGEEQTQQVAPGMPRNMPEISSTSSEKNFSSKYKSTTRKMIHRRATIEMYKRIMNNNLKREKRVEISRSNGEFGFRIHGSRPVVVSAIERGTSAETCGLQVGDLIYAINGTNILDMAHSDVVKLAHSADSSSLVLDLVPTNDFLRMSKYNRSSNKRFEPTVTGFLMRLSPSTAQPLLVDLQEQMSRVPGDSSQQRANKLNEVMRLAWRKRYFVLRSDNCLYWYRLPTDIEPYGGINLQGFSASLTNEFSEPSYVIRLVKYGSQPHYLGTNNICDIQTWIDAINKAATEANQNDPYMKRTLTLARTKPSQIPEPDCSGYLYKFSHKRSGGAHWKAAYFVLKDACLYLFRDQQADTVSQASAVYYLHGYRVRNKQIEHKKHTFELIPPNRKTIRPMFLMASSEIDRKRWIAALEYSIERWLEIE